jgi:hypothetical protein
LNSGPSPWAIPPALFFFFFFKFLKCFICIY